MNLGVHSEITLAERVRKVRQFKNALTIPANLYIRAVIYKNIEVGLGI